MTDTEFAGDRLKYLQKIAELEADLFQANTTISVLRSTVRNQLIELKKLDQLLIEAQREITGMLPAEEVPFLRTQNETMSRTGSAVQDEPAF